MGGVTPRPTKALNAEDAKDAEEIIFSSPHLTFPVRERDFIEIYRCGHWRRDENQF